MRLLNKRLDAEIRTLLGRGRPLRAREIADELTRGMGREVTRRRVNQALYYRFRPRGLAVVSDDYRWVLTPKGLVHAPPEQQREQKPTVGGALLPTLGGRYRLLNEIARGGMGRVYAAIDTKLDVRVAIKLTDKGNSQSKACRDRFKREAKIGSLLGRQTGFVRAFDWGEDEERFYLAMDLVEGAEPLDLVACSTDEALRRLIISSELVARAHAAGVIHRDLKPENFLVSPAGEISLADFGLAKSSGVNTWDALPQGRFETYRSLGLTQTGVGFGTPVLMAPEQFENAKDTDERADVYSLGAMLFLALTGRYPYDANTAKGIGDLHSKVSSGLLSPPRPRDFDSSLPGPLDLVAVAATAIRPDDRTSTVEAFLMALRAASGQKQVTNGPSQLPLTAVRSTTHRPRSEELASTRSTASSRASPTHTTQVPPSTASYGPFVFLGLAVGIPLALLLLVFPLLQPKGMSSTEARGNGFEQEPARSSQSPRQQGVPNGATSAPDSPIPRRQLAARDDATSAPARPSEQLDPHGAGKPNAIPEGPRSELKRDPRSGRPVETPGTKDYWTLGSHVDEVLRLEGTPTTINDDYGGETETYRFRNGSVKVSKATQRVVEWTDFSEKLKVRLLPGR